MVHCTIATGSDPSISNADRTGSGLAKSLAELMDAFRKISVTSKHSQNHRLVVTTEGIPSTDMIVDLQKISHLAWRCLSWIWTSIRHW